MPSATESAEPRLRLATSATEATESPGVARGSWRSAKLVPDTLEDMELPAILHALSDPVRLGIVSQLAADGELACGSLHVPVAKSTCSHHFRVLREAGVITQRVEGKCRFNRLRAEELDLRFPGLLDAVLQASRA